MSTLTFGKKTMRGPLLGPASKFPAIRRPIKSTTRTQLGEEDGLFIGYGMYGDSLPFTMQDAYDTAPVEQDFSCAVLENEHLRAEFVLDLGARLWSLYDKDGQRDLISNNPEFRPSNLAIRNAWFAGGIEYNIGRVGHDDQTCSPRFAAELKDSDGTPVLRIYEFDRNRGVPFQLDFYLPDGSRFLLARMRIMNIRTDVIPMYWWSNIAMPLIKGERLVVPCFDTFANMYDGGNNFLTKIRLPDGDGFDGTYPENFTCARDYFFNIPPEHRKYETLMMPEAWGGEAGVSHGFLFASTKRLQGRKLFVWGDRPGGEHWQRKLMGDADNYIEIQGGIGHTQQECLPMPPKTTWEWMEAYGAISAPSAAVFGDWAGAVSAVSSEVDRILPDGFLEQELVRTRGSFAKKRGEVRFAGSGWGALEERRRGSAMTEHLDFGEPGAEQSDWLALLESGKMPDAGEVENYMMQEEWSGLLDGAEQNWKTYLHRSLLAFRARDLAGAIRLVDQACKLNCNAWGLFVKASFYWIDGRVGEAMGLFCQTLELRNDDVPLAKETFKILILMNCPPQRLLRVFEGLDASIKDRPMLVYFHAYALAHCGRLDEAEALITCNGGLEIMDIREGERTITDLYIYIQEERAKLKGETFDLATADIPFILDMRTN